MKYCILISLLICAGFNAALASTAGKVRAGNRAYRNGRYEKSLERYREAEIAAPGEPAVQFNIGNALYKLGSPDEARAEYRKAAASENRKVRAQAYYNLGNAASRLQQTDEALQYYKKALEIDPGDEDAKYNYEYLLRRKGQNGGGKQDRDKRSGDDKQKQGGGEGRQQADGAQPEDRDRKGDGSRKEQTEGMSKEDARRILQVFEESDRNSAKERQLRVPQIPKVEEDW